MDKKILTAVLLSATAILLLASCEREKPQTSAQMTGLYILNEGNYQRGNSTLDYYDFATGEYHSDYYAAQNPGMTLGDTGNDILIHDGLLLITVNGTGSVEIADAATAKHKASVDVPDCRSMLIAGENLYVTSFADDGKLYKISLSDFTVKGTLQTGYDPEEMLYHDGKIYVLNSGGYHGYSDTVTVVDEDSFSVTGTIATGYRNLNMILGAGDHVYVSSLGNYTDDPGAIFTLDLSSSSATAISSVPASNWCSYGNTVYYQSTVYDASYNATHTFGAITGTTVSPNSSFINIPSDMAIPYCLSVNPLSGEFVLCDTDYSTAGTIYYFGKDGNVVWSHPTGINPGKVAWVY